ncbi:helix-turn-helix domain-containing protein [Nocardia bovistercoris]|uniref:Helix-turn-helix domain-containing protein n=1 Tax=Nocardia bovistercoris TaxID=2785916 RepID=A0A931ICY8_9NOCA|nr:helix-turn-helix domain-containing protein [Nocardia bovistercoris]MBH0779382.1 helix-turn-helix domain-containing protein [Nocardia bovistercoris]
MSGALRQGQMLRTLADVLVRIADGNEVERDWLIDQLATTDSPVHLSTASSELLEVPEACQRLRISKWSLYQLIHQRKIGTVKIGRRRFVPSTEVAKFIQELAAAGAAL